MSSENIKTGLKLSEAIKLLEENEVALIKPDNSNDDFYAPFPWTMATLTNTYSVKLPPPKTVTVTRADVCNAYAKVCKAVESKRRSLVEPIFDLNEFCKELGL